MSSMCNSISIEFDQLTFKATTNFFSNRKKSILKGLSGKFEGGQLTVILGPSGCGKSTLLNLLSGFQTKNMTGKIRMNGVNINVFRRNIAYIMQDNYLRNLLTVSESMDFAIKLKTKNNLSSLNKWTKITEILNEFGLKHVENEFVRNLSGGQKKRLAIALEIVDDPRVIFLDEPTTGLDSVSSTACLNILKKLTQNGKTVVCTVHQPTGNQLLIFDHLYAMSYGECVFQGSGSNLIKFLDECNLICPINYNLLDFLLEVVTGIYGEKSSMLVEKIENGKNNNYRASITSTYKADYLELSNEKQSVTNVSQFSNLILRNFIISLRERNFLVLRIFMHIFVGFLLGSVYYDIGTYAEHILDNFRLLFVIMSFLTYTSYYSIMVVFPINFSSIKFEAFNRWYTPGNWFIAMVVCDIPIIIITNIIFLIPVYYLTSQPFELFRFNTLLLILILTSFTSQAFGLIAGSFVDLKGTLIFAPILMIFHGAFSGFYLLKKDSHPLWHPFFEISFLKYSAYGTELSMLGFNRNKMECGTMYCHFRSPQKFLQSIGFEEDYVTCIWMLCINLILNLVTAYILIKRRMRHK